MKLNMGTDTKYVIEKAAIYKVMSFTLFGRYEGKMYILSNASITC